MVTSVRARQASVRDHQPTAIQAPNGFQRRSESAQGRGFGKSSRAPAPWTCDCGRLYQESPVSACRGQALARLDRDALDAVQERQTTAGQDASAAKRSLSQWRPQGGSEHYRTGGGAGKSGGTAILG